MNGQFENQKSNSALRAIGAECRILIVEDELSTQTIMEDALSSDCCKITPVCTESGANKHIRHPFDLFIIDLNLPDGTGLNIIKRIRQLEHHVDTPVIVTTASNSSKDIIASFKAGANDYLVKPFHSLILRSKARLLVQCRQKLLLLQTAPKTAPQPPLLNRNGI